MSSTDRFLLDQILSSEKAKNAPEMQDSDFFEYFVAEQVLKNYGLSSQEVEDGIVAGGNDGGIDAVFVFVDDVLASDGVEASQVLSEPTIELVAIQAKQSGSYSGTAVEKMRTTLEDLINFAEVPPVDLSTTYNSQMHDFINNYRETVRQLAVKFPKFAFRMYFVTKADSNEVHPHAQVRAEQLVRSVKDRVSGAQVEINFIGARDLIELVRRQAASTHQLRIVEHLSAVDGGHVCLVNLPEYFRFITDNGGARRSDIFTANVREYKGNVDVNRSIRTSLESPNANVNFWWLNNGITIVATRASVTGKVMTLENARVVNGLQTSHEIHKFFAAKNQPTEDRLILIRVIVTNDEVIRNAIIVATNNQSRIEAYALRATEPIHYDIEQHFAHSGLYYDRQKNMYRNQGKPSNKIVDVKFVAQAVAAILLRIPNDARGRSSKLLQDDDLYRRVFSRTYPMDTFLSATRIVIAVERYLKTNAPEYAWKERTNLRFQLAMYATMKVLGNTELKPEDLAGFDLEKLSQPGFLDSCLEEVWAIFTELQERTGRDANYVSKNRLFEQSLLKELNPSASTIPMFASPDLDSL